jgi:hypothetical protein
MAWNDAPPTAEELAPASSGGWDSTPPTPEELKDSEGFLEKTASNIIPDLGNVVKGAAGTIKEGAYDMPKRALETGVEMASGTPYSETPSGQKDTQFVEGAPKMAEEMARPVTHPIQYTEEHPVQQAMNAAMLFGLGKGAMGGEEVPPGSPPAAPPEVPAISEKPPTPETPPAAPAISAAKPPASSIPSERKVFHGTNTSGLNEYKPGNRGDDSNAIWFTDNKKYASEYGKNINEERIITNKPFDTVNDVTAKDLFTKWAEERGGAYSPGVWSKHGEGFANDGYPFWENNTWLAKKARDSGYDSIITSEGKGKSGIGVFDPKQIKKSTPTSAIPEGISDLVKKYSGKAAEAVPDNVKDYVKKASDAPLNRGTLSQYADKSARGMTMKVLGASPGQLRKIGEANANKLADFAMDKDIVNLKTGDIGVKEKIEKMNSESGQIVGDMRDLAGQRGGNHVVESLIDQIHSKLGDKYDSGMDSGGQSSYVKALQSVAKTPGTPKAIAQMVTDLFHKAKEENMAAGIHKLGAPKGPYADVARELRAANESVMSEKLTPKELNIYHNALEDYGASTQLNQFRQMKWSKDMGGRLPPGMGLARGALQKGLDTVGYRGLAQIQKNVAKWLSENPTATTTPKELFRHYVDESADAMDEIGEGVR